MKKKGQTEITVGTVVELIILVLVVGSMLAMVYKEVVTTKYDKLFLSKDMAMFIDAIYASPNNLIVKYPQETYDYSFVFEDSKVTVYEENETIALSESFPFTGYTNVEFDYKTITPESGYVMFKKTRRELSPFAGIFVGGT